MKNMKGIFMWLSTINNMIYKCKKIFSPNVFYLNFELQIRIKFILMCRSCYSILYGDKL